MLVPHHSRVGLVIEVRVARVLQVLTYQIPGLPLGLVALVLLPLGVGDVFRAYDYEACSPTAFDFYPRLSYGVLDDFSTSGLKPPGISVFEA
ncbi:hypothetical protein IG193_01640 [Infirmifilum lucidum]|uniref:Uncharacterized protein n=1 Tax=Infirmifilum lucidum TaxID=2776706 RepID=A0A7L9FHB3_9CREN|nr:hypothetical protein [Infirmifilum lucidum]QOJ79190.1 hypothetical protein IG193_01640 [Infirmifilum lucidum]